MNNDKQHLEDTKYVQWADGMYVTLDDLADPLDLQGYVLAVVEDSLRNSVYFCSIGAPWETDNCMGVMEGDADYLTGGEESSYLITQITRAQALYIATGDVNI
jgi:hypothetical protein